MTARSKAAEAKRATTINNRMVKARRAENSMWVHQAQAILDMRAVEGWSELGLESFEEWIAQPEIALGQSKARKLAASLKAYMEVEYDDFPRLGGVEYSKIAVTAAAVKNGHLDPDEAIDLAERLAKPDLEVEVAKRIRIAKGEEEPVQPAESEPAKCRCHCGHVHRPKGKIE